MARQARNRQKARKARQRVNWTIIGGIIGVGLLGLFALLFMAFQTPEVATLTSYCEENPDRCVVIGSARAPVTVVEISDFGCSHCRNFHEQTLPLLNEEYIATGQVRWIFLPFALRAQTVPAANAALCAREQAAYFEYAEALFKQQNESVALTRTGFVQAAEALSLNTGSFTQCLEEGRYNTIVQTNSIAASRAGVSGTPAFFIEGRKLEGAYPFATFQQHIDALLGS